MCAGWVVRSLIASLLLVAATGCFVFDEIDNAGTFKPAGAAPGAKVVAKSAGAAEPAAATPKAGAVPANPGAKPAAPSGDAWWKSASSLTSEESDGSITRCAVSGRTEFMKRDDCLARGGKPQ